MARDIILHTFTLSLTHEEELLLNAAFPPGNKRDDAAFIDMLRDMVLARARNELRRIGERAMHSRRSDGTPAFIAPRPKAKAKAKAKAERAFQLKRMSNADTRAMRAANGVTPMSEFKF